MRFFPQILTVIALTIVPAMAGASHQSTDDWTTAKLNEPFYTYLTQCARIDRESGYYDATLVAYRDDGSPGDARVVGDTHRVYLSGNQTSCSGFAGYQAEFKGTFTRQNSVGLGSYVYGYRYTGSKDPSCREGCLDGTPGTTTEFLPWKIQLSGTPPVALFTVFPDQPGRGSTVTFSDKSTDADGTIVAWVWDFGDSGSATGPSVSHSYANSGAFTVRLSVTDNDGLVSGTQRVINVLNALPVCVIAINVTSVDTGTLVGFADNSYDPDGRIVERRWDFGDGSSSASRNETHVFAHSGSYRVSLTVKDDSQGVATSSIDVRVLNRPPTARFTQTPEAPHVGDVIQFVEGAEDADGKVAAWSWDFGDGTALINERNPIHKFTQPGVFNVQLSVRDNEGGTANTTSSIEVQPVPPKAVEPSEPTPITPLSATPTPSPPVSKHESPTVETTPPLPPTSASIDVPPTPPPTRPVPAMNGIETAVVLAALLFGQRERRRS